MHGPAVHNSATRSSALPLEEEEEEEEEDPSGLGASGGMTAAPLCHTCATPVPHQAAWRSAEHMKAYFAECDAVVREWRAAGPQRLEPEPSPTEPGHPGGGGKALGDELSAPGDANKDTTKTIRRPHHPAHRPEL